MQPRDWLGLAIRIAALVFVVFACFDLFFVVAKALSLDTGSKRPLSADLAAAVFFAIIGVIGMLGADRIVALSYGPLKRD